MPKKVPPPTIPRLKVGHAVVGRSKLLKGGIMMVFIFDQAERWVEEFLEGSRMIWMRYGDTQNEFVTKGGQSLVHLCRRCPCVLCPEAGTRGSKNVQVALEYSFHFQCSMHVYCLWHRPLLHVSGESKWALALLESTELSCDPSRKPWRMDALLCRHLSQG